MFIIEENKNYTDKILKTFNKIIFYLIYICRVVTVCMKKDDLEGGFMSSDPSCRDPANIE